jgi:hypothetical protein
MLTPPPHGWGRAVFVSLLCLLALAAAGYPTVAMMAAFAQAGRP